MKRRSPPLSRRASILFLACLSWVLLRFVFDQFVWFRRETTLSTLTEGEYRVVRVVDWRSLIVTPLAGTRRSDRELRARVCLIGVTGPDCSTTDGNKDPPDPSPWQDAASSLTRDFVDGQTVRLRLDRRRIDRARQFLAYVFVADQMLNEELVRSGLAKVDVQPRDSSTMVRRLRKAEQQARERERGIWSKIVAQ